MLATIRSMPMIAMCTRGSPEHMRPLPSFSTRTRVPVSATPKFTPVMPTGARRKRSRRWARANAVRSAGSSPMGSPASGSSSARTSARLLWIAGMMMCSGASPAVCTMNSPRSVSATSTPAASRRSFRPISSDAIDLPLTTSVPCRSTTSVM